jgi:hypothetical protein
MTNAIAKGLGKGLLWVFRNLLEHPEILQAIGEILAATTKKADAQ